MNSIFQTLTNVSKTFLTTTINHGLTSFIPMRSITLETLHKRYLRFLETPPKKSKQKRSRIPGHPQVKGVILKTLIKKPRKPNSANRKCVLVRLSTGKEEYAFVPKEGHNLQEHQVVLVEGGRLKDTPGVKLRCIRGAYDLPHVEKNKGLKV